MENINLATMGIREDEIITLDEVRSVAPYKIFVAKLGKYVVVRDLRIKERRTIFNQLEAQKGEISEEEYQALLAAKIVSTMLIMPQMTEEDLTSDANDPKTSAIIKAITSHIGDSEFELKKEQSPQTSSSSG